MSQQAMSYKMALASLASNERYSEVLSHGTLTAGIYAPHESDEPEQHESDKVYVVLNGSGFFTVDDDREPFGPGDLLFAEAGTTHHFEGFTPDFAVWSISCSGGSAPA
ncbi:MAG TPA: cupin domain-containing protein [Acidimicrobiia bacterium]|nr:cupin domain-containing protein [Acidimicrobiia bacterium]